MHFRLAAYYQHGFFCFSLFAIGCQKFRNIFSPVLVLSIFYVAHFNSTFSQRLLRVLGFFPVNFLRSSVCGYYLSVSSCPLLALFISHSVISLSLSRFWRLNSHFTNPPLTQLSFLFGLFSLCDRENTGKALLNSQLPRLFHPLFAWVGERERDALAHR